MAATAREVVPCYVCGSGFIREGEESDESLSTGGYVWHRVICINCKRYLGQLEKLPRDR